MDKRVYKTQKAVFNAYMQLLSKQEKVTVKNICDNAGINKSTFYRNYEDIEDFQDKLVEKIADELIERLNDINSVYTDTRSFYEKILQILEEGCRFLELNIYVSKLIPLIVKLFRKFKNYFEMNNIEKYNHNRAIFVTGGIVSFLERNGDVLLLDAIKDFRNNMDILLVFTGKLIEE